MFKMDQSTICATHGPAIPDASPVQNLMEYNHMPPPFQITFIEGVIRDAENNVEQPDDETVRVRAALEGLSVKENVIAPIECLPPELLSEIFLACLPGFMPSRMYSHYAPLLLGQVCQHWRDVAKNTPALWSSISINLRPGKIEADVAMTMTHLSRSGGMPLSLRLEALWGYVFNDHPVLDILLHHCERWAEVQLELPFSRLRRFDVIQGRLPLLRSLKFTGPQVSLHRRVDAFRDAPQLRNLQLIQPLMPSTFDIPWRSLTKLIAICYTCGQVTEILRACSNLVSCRLVFVNDTSRHVAINLPLVHLRSLDIETGIHLFSIFESLTLPSLCDVRLMLHSYGYDTQWLSRPSFILLLSRSACTIQSLHLCCDQPFFSEPDLIACLEAMPMLIELEIRSQAAAAFTRRVVRRLTHGNNTTATCLIPKLEILRIDRCRKVFRDVIFAEMVQSRWRLDNKNNSDEYCKSSTTLAQIRTVEVVFIENVLDNVPIPETLRRLRIFRDEGMNATVVQEGGRYYLGCRPW